MRRLICSLFAITLSQRIKLANVLNIIEEKNLLLRRKYLKKRIVLRLYLELDHYKKFLKLRNTKYKYV